MRTYHVLDFFPCMIVEMAGRYTDHIFIPVANVAKKFWAFFFSAFDWNIDLPIWKLA